MPVHDDRKLFEFLTLEGAQAGLSWLTVLKKRENYRKAFAGFDPEKVAKFKAPKLRALLKDAGIIRNRLKIKAAVNNAQRFLGLTSARHSAGSMVEAFERRYWLSEGVTSRGRLCKPSVSTSRRSVLTHV